MIEVFMARQDENIKRQEAVQKEQQAAIRNLENQMGQMAKQLSERDPGTLPSDTHIPRIEDPSAITTRSGKVLPAVEVPVEVEEVVDEEVRVEKKKEGEKNREGEKSENLSKVPFPKALVKKNL